MSAKVPHMLGDSRIRTDLLKGGKVVGVAADSPLAPRQARQHQSVKDTAPPEPEPDPLEVVTAQVEMIKVSVTNYLGVDTNEPPT